MAVETVFNKTYEKSLSVFTYLGAVLTVLGVIYGVWTAQWELNRRRATNHLGPVCQDQDEMGSFVVDIPQQRRRLWPFFIRRVPKPLLPTLSAIMTAGDNGMFTSSMFEWIPFVPAEQRHITWIAFYESMFREYTWYQEWPRQGGMQLDIATFNRDDAKYLGKIMDRSALDVWKAKRKAEGKCYKTFRYSFLLFTDWLRTTCQQLPWLGTWFEKLPMAPPVLSQLHKMNPDDMDPHLMYYSWHWPGKEFGPLLVRSHVKLTQLSAGLALAAPRWKREDFKKVRIRGDKPFVEVSEEEIAALSLTMGVELRAEEYLPHGVGPFGSLILSETDDCMSKLKVVYHDTGKGERIGGSGYSILFAKHMACGCLPFATDATNGWVHTIYISNVVHNSIISGQGVSNKVAGAPEDAVMYLNNLPPPGNTNFYRAAELVNGGTKGSIYSFAPGISTVGTWPEAVTRISFGGLAPMATQTLVDSVKFTVGGEMDSSDELKKLNELINRVIVVADNQAGGRVPLFGADQRELSHKMGMGEVYFPTPGNNGNIRQVVKDLAKYTTLLEYLIARTPTPLVDAGAASTPQEVQRDLVFSACLNDITSHYNASAAAGNAAGRRNFPRVPGRRGRSFIEDTFDRAITAVSMLANAPPSPFPVDLCADVARCLIMAWTTTVRITHWGAGAPANTFSVVPLSKLPDVAVWE
ncbi:hypothetical protein V2G26_009323 [Clonostachys chloroleuca]